MTEFSTTGLIAAFAAGGISFLSPCVLPLVPGYVSYVAGQSITGRAEGGAASLRLQAVSLSLCFVLGFSTVFVLLGASATMLGQLLLSYRHELNIVVGAIVIAFGLFTLGVLRPSWLQRDFRLDAAPRRRPADCGLRSWHGLRFRLDTVHRPDPRGDFDGERSLGDGCKRRGTPRRLFSWPGCPVLAGGSIHRRPLGKAPVDQSRWSNPATSCGRSHGPHGCRDDHRTPLNIFLLAARRLPDAVGDRVNVQMQAQQ
jgi:Cytochrome C biogenesis protein transmembrane region